MNHLAHTLSDTLPRLLYTAAQVRELDRLTIEKHGIAGIDLMTRAAQAAFACLQRQWPRARSLSVFCGVGNNGGDGFILARLAHAAGYAVRVCQLGDATHITGDALTARQQCLAAGLVITDFTGADDCESDVLVDALLGTGLSGEVQGIWREAIETINHGGTQGRVVLALDIPSGLHADTGSVLGLAVQADVCITFIALKLGLFNGQGAAVCGGCVFDDLKVPAAVYEKVPASATRIRWSQWRLSARSATAHKGDFGHVLVLGGDHGMAGALHLAGEAALRTGAGLVTLATRETHAPHITAARPELMSLGIESALALVPLLKRASVLAVGPGLGQQNWGRVLFSAALQSPLPMVVDADALNLLALNPVFRCNWVLTPHPGEAARLLAVSIEDVQADRVAAGLALQKKYGGVVVLKGAGTLVVNAEGQVFVCDEGNPGMASGGMGDVLTGVIAALLAQGDLLAYTIAPVQGRLSAQGCALSQAALLGVCLHTHAADLAAQEGQRGLLASDLFPLMRRLLG
jgi:ADP-dependent NAD(P)H-hydrate dehydratase / NAD(P)H-hydrate epimerase